MTPDYYPIPRDSLPPGWGLAEHCGDRIVYRHTQPPLALIATKSGGDQTHPCLGINCCWELHYRFTVGDYAVTRPIGRVTTRSAALNGLLECMHQLNDAVDDQTNPTEISAVLERVPLADVVPEI